MFADAAVTASPIEGEVMAERTDPLETINPAERSAKIDRHSIFGIVLPGLKGSVMRVTNSRTKQASLLIPAQTRSFL
jgi:hypothetical protein